MVDEGAARAALAQGFQHLGQGIRGQHELTLVEAHPLAAVPVGVLFQPFVVGERVEVIAHEIGARPYLVGPQRVVEAPELGVGRKECEPPLGDLARRVPESKMAWISARKVSGVGACESGSSLRAAPVFIGR
jgi:hypothetical protein